MKQLSTEELYHEIKNATNAEDFLTKNQAQLLHGTLSTHLHMLLSQKKLSRAEVVRGSLLDCSPAN